MTARTFRMYPPVSKAGKPKNSQWDRASRFRGGHDAGCYGMLPEAERMKNSLPTRPPRRMKVAVWKSASFGLTREQRIIDDCFVLLNHGLAENLEEALAKAEKNNPVPDYSSRG